MEQLHTTVASLNTSRGIILPPLKELDEFPRELVRSELHNRFDTVDSSRRLPLAYALAHFGDVQVEFLVAQVHDCSPDEVDNLVAAFSHSTSEAVSSLASAAESAEAHTDWRYKARLALVLLRLNAPTLAQDMCQLRADPVQRTWFIEECSTWHGDLSALVTHAAVSDDIPLRTALALVAGSASESSVTHSHRMAWEPVLVSWYRNEPDSLTHSVADWTLRKWNLALPAIVTSVQPIESRDWHVNGLGMTMLRIHAGSFTHDTWDSEHLPLLQTVVLTRSFLLSDREISLAQFRQFIADPDYQDDAKPLDWEAVPSQTMGDPSDQRPVEGVNWFDAVLFCNWLSRREGFMPCYVEIDGEAVSPAENPWRVRQEATGYRLPTQAEWEFACRAGTTTSFSFGDDTSFIDRYAVIRSDLTSRNGSKFPNPWGLFDVHGNVCEWCYDGTTHAYGTDATVNDPVIPDSDGTRALRGGHYRGSLDDANSSLRSGDDPKDRAWGFRVARTYDQ